MSSGLWIIVLEAGLALALVAFLVWWTLPRRREREDREEKDTSGTSERH